MSKLMSVLGIVLLAVGAALALVGFMQPAQILVHGLTMDTAATLVVGGIVSLGLGGVISAVAKMGPQHAMHDEPAEPSVPVIEEPAVEEPKPVAEPVVAEVSAPSRIRFPGFGRKPALGVGDAAPEPMTPSVQETIDALEQAKTDINKALTGAPAAEEAPAEQHAEGDLYVVEDKVIRGRPARILSDGTVEAETDEGWMRFENLDHLNEYLDSTQPDT